VRNEVVRACARYGTAGPIGEVRLARATNDNPEHGPIVGDPDFYVVDDYYGDHQRIYVEPRLSAVSVEWLLELARRLHRVGGWDVLVSFGEGIFAAVSPDEIDVGGLQCRSTDLSAIVEAIRKQVAESLTRKDATKSQRLAIVSQLVPSAWAAQDSLALVAHFSSAADGSVGDSVWLLHRGDRSIFDLDKHRLEPDAVRPSVYWVRPSGEILAYEGNSEDGTLSLLAEWTLRSKGKPVQGATRVRVRKGAQTWDFDLRPH
jgi:hypothetical protein